MSADVIPLALLDGYKVRWTRETVARDIVQNFFDEVDDFREVTVEVDAARGLVEVRGPSRFDLSYLRYIGATTKATRRAAGGFGEGFKVCALVLVRDFHGEVTAGSGAWEIRPVLRAMKLGRELCYEVEQRPSGQEHPGSFVRIEGADARLCAAFAGAKELFRHPDNPRLQAPIYVDEQAGVGVFAAQNPKVGDLYYRRQHRGGLRYGLGGALTFAFDDRLAAHEGDRDRRDLTAAWPLIGAVAQRLPDAVLERLVRHLRAYWSRGGKVLNALLAEAGKRGLHLAFPRRWLARVQGSYFLDQHAERAGYHLGVQQLGLVGMPTVEDRYAGAEAARAPTAVEAARMVVASELYALLAGEPPLFTRFRVVELERHGHDFRGKSCTVPAASLAAPFAEGIAPCLARLACGTGLRSRRNADRLTALLEGATRRAGTLTPYAERWAAAAVDPGREAIDLDPHGDEEEDPDPDLKLPQVAVCLLVPPGFPPARELRARIKKIAAAQRVNVCIHDRTEVSRPRDAAVEYARGVPSVWIGGTEVEPVKGSRPSFAVRTFAAPDGARALLPSDETLAAEIAAEVQRVHGSRRTSFIRTLQRNKLGRTALLRWLAVNAPGEHRAWIEAVALNAAIRDSAASGLPEPAQGLVRSLARRALPASLDEDGALDAVEDAHERVAALLVELEASGPGLTAGEPAVEPAFRLFFAHLEKDASSGVAEDTLFTRAVAAAPGVMEISRASEAAPLDAACVFACTIEALARLWEASAAGDPAAARSEARARFDASVELAIQRHDQRDADGHPPSCYELRGELAARYGRPYPAPPPSGPSPVAVAVTAAWDEAIAAGLSEVEAAGRCLAAAERASATLTAAST